MKGVALLALVALAACGQASSRGTATSTPRSLAVAGLSIGATPAEAAATLGRAGYTKKRSVPGPNFEQAVQRARGNDSLQYAGAIKEESYGKGGETVSLTYVAMPNGPVAQNIGYSVPPGVASMQKVVDEFTRRHGPATRDGNGRFGREVVWCATPGPGCERRGQHLSVSATYRDTSAFLEDPTVIARQRQAILAAPGGGKPTF